MVERPCKKRFHSVEKWTSWSDEMQCSLTTGRMRTVKGAPASLSPSTKWTNDERTTAIQYVVKVVIVSLLVSSHLCFLRLKLKAGLPLLSCRRLYTQPQLQPFPTNITPLPIADQIHITDATLAITHHGPCSISGRKARKAQQNQSVNPLV